ncbi:MAG TPA: hypothetical protein VLA71_11040, partial [Algoriphagus sp.]|nr:hypothetical protein [Algoriphagus sp.]
AKSFKPAEPELKIIFLVEPTCTLFLYPLIVPDAEAEASRLFTQIPLNWNSVPPSLVIVHLVNPPISLLLSINALDPPAPVPDWNPMLSGREKFAAKVNPSTEIEVTPGGVIVGGFSKSITVCPTT